MKLFAAVDLSEGKVVRFVKGDPKNKVVYSNDPLKTAIKWEKEGADALHVVDLDATLQRSNNLGITKLIVENVNIPVEVAGGIRTFELASNLLKSADRVVLGTMAYQDESSVEKLVKEFGNDRIVVAIDQLNEQVMIEGWRKPSGMSIFEAIQKFKNLSVEYFLLTSIDRDGTLSGPDLQTLHKACSIDGVKIIASGGISNNEDIAKVRKTGAYAVILGKALYDGKVDMRGAQEVAR